MTELPSLPPNPNIPNRVFSSDAYGINESNVIVGSAFNNQTRLTSAFMLTPVPEANTLVMVLLGLAGVALAQRRKNLLRGAWA